MSQRPRILQAGFWLAILLLPAWLWAKESFDYQECSALTNSNPQKALEYANRWLKQNKNEAFAHHCQALATYGLQRFGEAAEKLEAVAEHPNLPEALKTQIWEQAEQAWKRAHDDAKADIALGMAIEAADRQKQTEIAVKLLIRRAQAYIAQNKPLQALQELDHALTLDPSSQQARALKVSVLGQLGKPELSLEEGSALNPAAGAKN